MKFQKYWNVAKGGSDRNDLLKDAMDIFLDSLTQIATLPNYVCHDYIYTHAAYRHFQILILLIHTNRKLYPLPVLKKIYKLSRTRKLSFPKQKPNFQKALPCLERAVLLFKQMFVHPDFGSKSNYSTSEYLKLSFCFTWPWNNSALFHREERMEGGGALEDLRKSYFYHFSPHPIQGHY